MTKSHQAIGLLLLVGVAGWGVHYWKEAPRTPKELFEKRCSTCHDLPDLSGYQLHELAPLVHFMRTHNGAARVISDEETKIIISYLENKWPIQGEMTRVRGN